MRFLLLPLCVLLSGVAMAQTCTPTITATPDTVCAGQSTTLTATGATTYTWSPGGFTGSSMVVTPSSNTVYTVTASTGTCVASASIQVMIVQNPTLAVTASSTICAGSSTTLSVVGATTYTWSPGVGLNSITAASVIASPTSTTVYSVTGTIGTCTSAIGTSTVTVNPLPNLTVTNNGPVCFGASVWLNSSAVGIVNYSWSGPSGFISSLQNPSLNNVTLSSSGVYTLVGTDVNGCVGTATTNVIVNPNPVVTVNSSTICSGATATLTAVGASTYSWSSGQTGATVVVNPATPTTYTVVGTDANACSDTIYANVNVTATPTISVSASTATVCPGQSTTLTASGATNYTWSANAGSAQTNTVTVTPFGPATYTVVGDNMGCSSIQVISINVATTPTIVVSVTNPMCAGQTATLTASTAGGTPPYMYTWAPSGGTNSTTNVSTSGAYTINVTDANGCNAVAMATAAVPSALSETFSMVPDTIPHVWDALVTYSGGTPPYAASWNWGDGNSTTGLYPSHNYATAGTYSICVTVTDANGCVSTFCQNDSVYRSSNSAMIQVNVIHASTGIRSIVDNTPFSIFPNPVSDEFTLMGSGEACSVSMYNSLGELTLFQYSPGDPVKVNVCTLRPGIYFVSVQSASGVFTQRMIIQR